MHSYDQAPLADGPTAQTHSRADHTANVTQHNGRAARLYPNSLGLTQVDNLPFRGTGAVESSTQEELTPSRHLQQATSEAQDRSDGDTVMVDDHAAFLKYDSIAQARQKAQSRVPLEVDGDDWELFQRNRPLQKAWAVRIMTALRQPYKAQPDARKGGAHTAEELTEWTRWQNDSKRVFGLLLKGYGGDIKATLGQRLLKIERIIQDSSVVRVDVLKQRKLAEFAADPEGFLCRKLTNLWVNYNKAVRQQEMRRLMKQTAKADAEARGEVWDDVGSTASKAMGDGSSGRAGPKRYITAPPKPAETSHQDHYIASAAPKRNIKAPLKPAGTSHGDYYTASSECEGERERMLPDPASKDLSVSREDQQ
ncbi:hypothetical protein LTR08_005387 [Meristemomyces frigidus]|nr:hypothetical protein LTR08_005387 [Meristemomyces frigidus]